MKLNVIASAFIMSLGLATTAANAADAGGGTITFTGAIVDAPCSINPDSSDQEVDLGQVALSQLEDNGVSKPQAFKINLENCTYLDDGKGTGGGNGSDGDDSRALVAPSVKVQFGGSKAVADNDTWFGITGTASGAGVVITDAAGTPIPVGGSSAARELLDGNNTLGFSAYLQGLGKEITIGEFEAVTDFALSYE